MRLLVHKLHNFSQNMCFGSYRIFFSKDGSDEPVQMRRLVRAFAARMQKLDYRTSAPLDTSTFLLAK